MDFINMQIEMEEGLETGTMVLKDIHTAWTLFC